MKYLLIFMLFIGILLVYALEKTDLEVGENYLIDDKNVTLIKIDSRHDNAIFCVNGEKGIVREDGTNNINEVYVELESLKDNSVRVELSYKCEDCICDTECNNEVCFEAVDEIVNEDNLVEDEQIIVKREVKEGSGSYETIINQISIDTRSVVIAILIVLVLLLGVIVLWRRS